MGGSETGRRSVLTRRIAVPRWAAVLLALTVALLVLVLWSVLHREPSNVSPFSLGDFDDLLPSIAGLTQGQIVDGNAAEVIQDAAFFDRVVADVDAARRTVHFETFVWWEGTVCEELAAAFVRAAGRGVTVRLLVDAWGARNMDPALRRRMTDAGVTVAEYHPISWRQIGNVQNRDHRKTAVVDGRIAYAFGHGVAEEWDDVGPETWEDTAVRIRGPLVAALQSSFLANWMATTGEVPVGEEVFPDLEPEGGVRGHVVTSSAPGSLSTVKLLYKLAIASAREEILIQNPYFVPDSAVVELLAAAEERGVRVRVMLPGPEATDSKLVLHASHVLYPELLEAGVEIFEYRPTLLHKKIMVVDRLWSHIGSTNFDSLSLEVNEEVSVGLIDPAVAAILAAEFERDAEGCRRVDPETWSRTWYHRLLDASVSTLQETI